MIPYIILILIVICIISVYKYMSIKSEYNSILKCIHNGENEIDKMLIEKSELLDVICENINSLSENVVFSPISKLMKKNLDSYKLDRGLSEAYNELKEYLFVNKNYIPEDEIKEKIDRLHALELDLVATKKYYNDNSNSFNSMIESFPSSIVGKRKGYDFKFLYTFEEEQLFEILKKDNKKKIKKKEVEEENIISNEE